MELGKEASLIASASLCSRKTHVVTGLLLNLFLLNSSAFLCVSHKEEEKKKREGSPFAYLNKRLLNWLLNKHIFRVYYVPTSVQVPESAQ